MLGDRLAVAKLLLEALERQEITEDQAERWFDNLTGVSIPLEPSRSPSNATEPSYADDLARVDAEERREAQNAAQAIPDDVEAELARLTPEPIQPVPPGQNLLDDPEGFKQRIQAQKARKLQEGTPHR